MAEQIARAAAEQGRRTAAEELVTVLAHDLRNLLAPIGARLQLLKMRAARDERQVDARDAESGLESLERLGRMINSLLDIARIRQGLFAISAQPLDIAELARSVARLLTRPGHAVEVAASQDISVVGDPERLRQCLENLVTNAVQHSPEGAPVTIVIRKESKQGTERARVQVRDQGPGIPAEVLPHIFERFVSGRPSGGLGLGLYLARRIAEAHGGALTVDSATGRGTCFTLELPCLGC